MMYVVSRVDPTPSLLPVPTPRLCTHHAASRGARTIYILIALKDATASQMSRLRVEEMAQGAVQRPDRLQ